MIGGGGEWDRFQRAIQVYLDWVDSDPPVQRQVLLAENQDIHDLLEDFLSADGEPERQRSQSSAGSVPVVSRSFRWRPVGFQQDAQVGRYTIGAELGAGGSSVVYRASELSDTAQRTVALKVLNRRFPSPQDSARFCREAKNLSRLQHPNIASLYEAAVTADGTPYLVMERVPFAVSLTGHCDKHQLSISERVELLVQVCQAVHYAHTLGVLHRDLKPANILVGHYGDEAVPQVIDFGNALDTSVEAGKRLTLDWQVFGTPEYMSPEQLCGGPVDARSDQFALGVVAYELLVGCLPRDLPIPDLGFAAICSHASRARIVQFKEIARDARRVQRLAGARRTTQSQLSKLLKGDLSRVIECALRGDPRDRYDSVAELGRDLQRAVDGDPVSVRQPSAWYLTRRAMAKRPLVTALVLALATVLIVAGGVLTWLYYDLAESHDRLRQSTYVQCVSSASHLLESGSLARAQTSLSTVGPASGWEWRYLNRRANGVLASATTPEAVSQLGFTSDGQQLLAAGRDSVLRWDAKSLALLDKRSVIGKRDGKLVCDLVALSQDGSRFLGLTAVDESTQTRELVEGSLVDPRELRVVTEVSRLSTRRCISYSEDFSTVALWARGGRRGPREARIGTRLGADYAFRELGDNVRPFTGRGGAFLATDGESITRIEAGENAPIARMLGCDRIHVAGKYIAVWNEQDLRLLEGDVVVLEHSLRGAASTVAIHAECGLLGVGYGDGFVEVLALDLPELASTTQAHDGAVLELAFHPDGSSYASYGADSTVSVRLALERQRIARRPYVTDFDVDMQGEVLVLARSGQRPIEQSLLYAVETGEVLGDLPLPASCRSSACVALGPTRSFVVVAGMDGSLHVCSTREGASSLTLLPEDRDRQFCALDVSPNGALLVATAAARSTGQQEVTLWDLAELRCLARRDVPRSHVATARFSPAGELVIIAMDQKVLVYDAQLERLVLTAGTTSGVATVRPGEDEIAVATPGGQIQVISIADGSERRTSARFVTTAVQGAWSPDGNRMAVAGTGKIVIVDGDTLEPLLELPCRGTVKKLFFHEQRPWLLALTDHVKKGTVWRWDAGSAADSLTRSRDMEERVARARVLAESPADRSQSITSPLTERDQWIRDTADHLRIWRKSKSE